MYGSLDDLSRKSCRRCTAWLPANDIKEGLCRSCWSKAFNSSSRVVEGELKHYPVTKVLENLFWKDE